MNEYNPADQQAGIAYAERVASERFASTGEQVSQTTRMLIGCAFEAGAAHGRVVPAGLQLVPVERIHIALEAVQNAMLDAYSNAYHECCGRGQGQCCGDPDAAWSAEDQRIMDALAPAQRELSALLAAAPAAPVAQEPVAFVSQETFSSDGTSDILTRNLPIGTALYTAPPAAEQPAPSAPVAPWPATWVSVADRLPGEDSEVIVSGWAYNDPARGRFVTHADFSDGQFKPVGAADEYDALHPPTHWMPMPAAPGEAPTPAAKQSDTVAVPRELLEEAALWLEAHSPGSGSEESYTAQELRALLAGGAK